jgi:hypothetical protein
LKKQITINVENDCHFVFDEELTLFFCKILFLNKFLK